MLTCMFHPLTAVVVKPSGETVPVQVVPAGEGSVKVVFNPTEPGPHVLKVLFVILKLSINNKLV